MSHFRRNSPASGTSEYKHFALQYNKVLSYILFKCVKNKCLVVVFRRFSASFRNITLLTCCQMMTDGTRLANQHEQTRHATLLTSDNSDSFVFWHRSTNYVGWMEHFAVTKCVTLLKQRIVNATCS